MLMMEIVPRRFHLIAPVGTGGDEAAWMMANDSASTDPDKRIDTRAPRSSTMSTQAKVRDGPEVPSFWAGGVIKRSPGSHRLEATARTCDSSFGRCAPGKGEAAGTQPRFFAGFVRNERGISFRMRSHHLTLKIRQPIEAA